jgi:hypothetical protein
MFPFVWLCFSTKFHYTKVRKECFYGVVNLRVALAHKDLAFATFRHEYNTESLEVARNHAEKALDICTLLLPTSHPHKASSQHVLAQALVEMAEIAIEEAVNG